MTLAQLRYFMEVCRQENVTKAAEALHVAQPSVTVAIRDLEEELGVVLFRRVRRRIFLTDEGRFFFAGLGELLGGLDSLTETVAGMGEGKKLVRIGIGPMVGTFLLPRIFAGFKSACPEIGLEVSEFGALELQRRVREETLDVAITLRETEDGPGFRALATRETVFYVGPGSGLKGPLSLDDLRDEPLVMFDENFYLSRRILSAFEKRGIVPNVVLRTGQLSTVKRFVRENMASAFLIEGCVEPADALRSVPLREAFPVVVGAEWKQSRSLGGNVKKFIEFIGTLSGEKGSADQPGMKHPGVSGGHKQRAGEA